MKMNLEKRVVQIEAREEINAKVISKRFSTLESQVYCGITTGHRHLTLVRKTSYGFLFCCTNCDLDYFRSNDSLTEKEAELVTIIFPEQEKGKNRK